MLKVLEAFGEPISHGGQEAFIMNYARNADYNKLVIDYLTPYYCDNKELSDFVKNKNGKVIAFNKEFNPGRSRFNICQSLEEFFKRNSYDVVHIHSGSISILGIFAYYAKRNDIKKVIVHSHASIEHKSIKNTILRYLFGIVLNKYADVYCACSEAAGNAKFTEYIVKNKLVIIRNGIDLNKFSYNEDIRTTMRESLKINKEEFVIGHVGRFSKEKNHEFLINLFSKLRLNNSNAKLILVGDGERRSKIQNLVNLKGLQDKVIFTGNVTNVQDYMQAMDFFVFPSNYEGLGLVAIEAQAVGLPCLLSTGCPLESKVTNIVEFERLDSGVKAWVDKVIMEKNLFRNKYNKEVNKAGYSIFNLKKQLEALYFD